MMYHGLKETDLNHDFSISEDTNTPTINQLQLINKVLPQIKSLLIPLINENESIYLLSELKKFENLKNLTINLTKDLKFPGHLIRLDKIKIKGFYSDTLTIENFLQKTSLFSQITFQECLLNKWILQYLKYENIKHLSFHNIGLENINLLQQVQKLLNHLDLDKIELLDVGDFKSNAEGIVNEYIKQAPHKNLKEIAFSLNDEEFEISNFLKLSKLKNISIYYCLYLNKHVLNIILPLLINFPNVKFNLIEYLPTNIRYTRDYINMSGSKYYKIHDEIHHELTSFNNQITFSYIKNPFTTIYEEDLVTEKSTKFPPMRSEIKTELDEDSESVDTSSTIGIQEYWNRLEEFEDDNKENIKTGEESITG